MFVDLSDEITRTVVQEYVNEIVNFQTKDDLSYNVHKLMHTFQVVEVARELIDLSKGLKESDKKLIIKASLLHDIARCHQFEGGKYNASFNHAEAGAELIQKYFPHLKNESLMTYYHSDLPLQNDPQEIMPALNYLRDADMLANIRFQTEQADLFLSQFQSFVTHTHFDLVIDDEIKQAVKERRAARDKYTTHKSMLNVALRTLLWVFILQTEAAAKYVKKHKSFYNYRTMIIEKVLPLLTNDKCEIKKLSNEILTMFPDSFFDVKAYTHDI